MVVTNMPSCPALLPCLSTASDSFGLLHAAADIVLLILLAKVRFSGSNTAALEGFHTCAVA